MDVVTTQAATKVVAARGTGSEARGRADREAELVAGAAAGLAFRVLNPNDK